MNNWISVIPRHVKLLKLNAIIVILLICFELLSLIGIITFFKHLPKDYLLYFKFVLLFADLGLSFLVLKFIKNNYPNKLPPVKQQYWFLLLVYFVAFGVIVYISIAFQIAYIIISMGELVAGLELSVELILPAIIIIVVLLKLVCLPLLQIHGFKLVKEIRSNFRSLSSQSTDLL